MRQTDGATSSTAARKVQRPRRKNELHNGTIAITEVNAKGVPVLPPKDTDGYNNALGCIVRKTVLITCPDMVNSKPEYVTEEKQKLQQPLNTSYTFPLADKALAEEYAIGKLNELLKYWRCRSRQDLLGSNFETVIKFLYPQLKPDRWQKFCESSTSEEFKKKSAYFRGLWTQVPGNHHLGTGGYRGAECKWVKEDEEFQAVGKPLPFVEHVSYPRPWGYFRAHAVQDKGSKDYYLPTLELR